MAQTIATAVIVVLVGHVGRGEMSVHRAGVGVAERAPIGRRVGWKGTLVLRMSGSVQAMNGINVRESGGVLLLVRRVSVAKL